MGGDMEETEEVKQPRSDQDMRLAAIGQANQPWRNTMNAAQMVSDAKEIYAFLIGKDGEAGKDTGQYI